MLFCARFAYPGLAAAGLLLSACASVPPPTDQLAASRAAIESAEVAGAGKDAPADLTQARDKLTAAQLAVNAGENQRARRLAEEALVDAQLAQARASTTRSRAGLEQAEATLRALREEANRPTPPAGPAATTPVPPTQPASPAPITPVTPTQ